MVVREPSITCHRSLNGLESSPSFVGSEQALAPVRLPDTFAEGAWDKVPKTERTFDLILQNTNSLNC